MMYLELYYVRKYPYKIIIMPIRVTVLKMHENNFKTRLGLLYLQFYLKVSLQKWLFVQLGKIRHTKR